jgi:hypothetical protein
LTVRCGLFRKALGVTEGFSIDISGGERYCSCEVSVVVADFVFFRRVFVSVYSQGGGIYE